MYKSEKPVVFFDGTCILCSAFFQWLIKNDKQEIFLFSTLQSKAGVEIVHQLGIKAEQETIILLLDTHAFTFSSAVLKILVLLGGRWKILGRIGFIFPKFLRDAIYLLVSRNRYKWFGQQACMIPDQMVKSRFIDI